jgi:hypothetical protein
MYRILALREGTNLGENLILYRTHRRYVALIVGLNASLDKNVHAFTPTIITNAFERYLPVYRKGEQGRKEGGEK